MCLIT
jgi:hypothetical protein